MAVHYALMGMDSWYFGRVDWCVDFAIVALSTTQCRQDRDWRTVERHLEMVMEPSASLGATVDIFTGITNGYGSTDAFVFLYIS